MQAGRRFHMENIRVLQAQLVTINCKLVLASIRKDLFMVEVYSDMRDETQSKLESLLHNLYV